ncbi:aldose epimerase family protein [Lacticaseibacillus mingshuiensis]|uniref:Aldose epimerase family protein n=1 Tax=Lacticaseibacillus mingshuiensis TaxID=2799574 RepID=A0ABW4CHS0_9LACO|nr:aldose epimerase family protein [Lacticaseibacillus mingshuiensis]
MQSLFGQINGQPVTKYSVTNANGVTLSCLSFGATWYSLTVPTDDGPRDVVLHYRTAEEYDQASSFLCKTIGRTAGRIGKGQATLNGQLVQVPTNENGNTLHGGKHGLHDLNWDGRAEGSRIIFTCHMPSSVDGYPGDLDAQVEYLLDDNDTVTISYSATASEDTLWNPTCHIYFNLDGADNTINAQDMQVLSDQRLELDEAKIPTGNLLPLADTPYDFKAPANLGAAIDGLQDIDEKGIDDVYVISEHEENDPVCTLWSSDKKVSVALTSPRNGLVVYSGNHFEAADDLEGYEGRPYVGIAVEAQTLPTAATDDSGTIKLAADEQRDDWISYKFTF